MANLVPKGNLVTLVGFDPDGNILPLQVDANGFVKVSIEGSTEAGTMLDPKGNLVSPVGFDPDGSILPIQMTAGGLLRVVSEGGSGNDFLPLGVYIHVNPFTLTNMYPYSVTIDRTLTLVKFPASFIVGTTNDASNYWKFELYEWVGDGLVASLSTASSSPDTKTEISTTSFSINPVTVSHKALYMKLTKTGSPGTLYLLGPILEVTQ